MAKYIAHMLYGQRDHARKVPHFSNPYLLPWNSILMPGLGRSDTASKVVARPEPVPQVKVRKGGPMLEYEKSDWFQASSAWCVTSKPDFLSFEDMLCHGIIDVGLSIIIAAKKLQDVAVCSGVALTVGEGGEMVCLLWAVIRLLLPGWLPKILDLELNYAQQRMLL